MISFELRTAYSADCPLLPLDTYHPFQSWPELKVYQIQIKSIWNEKNSTKLRQRWIGWRYFKYIGERYPSNRSFIWKWWKFWSHWTIGWQFWTIDEYSIAAQADCCMGRWYDSYFPHLWLFKTTFIKSFTIQAVPNASQSIKQNYSKQLLMLNRKLMALFNLGLLMLLVIQKY